MKSLYRLVDEHTLAGRRFAWFIQFLIILSMVTFTIETLPDLPRNYYRVFFATEIVIVAIFTVEYVLRLASAPHKLRFVFSFFGLVDLAAILPFYLATGLDLRSVRILRVLRLVRIVKLFRYNRAAKRLVMAFFQVRDELILFIVMIVILIYLSSVGIYYFENEAQPDKFKSVPHSMWWAVATLTTVGYGDIYPVTAGGRFFTFVVLILGLGVIAVPTGLVASALTDLGKDETGETDADESAPRERPASGTTRSALVSQSTREKWDARYADRDIAAQAPARVVQDFSHLLPRHGRALDVACGLGGNAIALAERGLQVRAIDISPVAIDKLDDHARASALPIRAEVVDLEREPIDIGEGEYDVVLVARYLNRRICAALPRALKPGGLLFYQTFTRERTQSAGGPGNPDYLLERGELLAMFSELECVVYRDEALVGDLDQGFRNEAMFVGQKA